MLALPSQVRARELDDLVAAAAQNRLQHIERKAFRHLDGDGRRHGELLARHDRVNHDWAGVGECFGDARVDDDIARVGRAGAAPDIAPVILFLCSDGARWINGANVPVDGGLEASINAEVLGF